MSDPTELIGRRFGQYEVTVEQFRQMMLDGGRSIEGNRSKKENAHG